MSGAGGGGLSHAQGDGVPLAGVAILVVDDDRILRCAVVRLLQRAGACVRQAAHGDEALGLAASGPVDLLLTDMEMPGRDGADVALAIATLCPRVGIVFMSGTSRARHVENGRLADAARLVEKPFVPEVLVGTLAAALASARATAGPARLGDPAAP